MNTGQTGYSAMVEARRLTKRYGRITAVDQIDLHVASGECFGLLGPNGAGKTTTIKMIQCVSPPSGGTLTVNGKIVGLENQAIKAALGVVPQEDNLDDDLTVIDNLVIYAGYFDIPSDIAREKGLSLLKFVHLDDRPNSRIRSLSGGMKRRLTIARALINNPDLLILDEPTTGLDPQARHVIWRKLQNLKAGGTTMILTTHYMEEAARLCDRVAIMDNGTIILEGEPGRLVREGMEEDVIEIRPRAENMDDLTSTMENMGARVERTGDTLLIFTERPESVVASLAGYNSGYMIKRKTTLEDLFLRTTGHKLRDGS